MSEPHADHPPRKNRRIIESLPAAAEVREEVRRTSRRMRLLMLLLGVCEKAEVDRPSSSPRSATD
jgi:hypothetical protein